MKLVATVLGVGLMLAIAPAGSAQPITPNDPNFQTVSALTANGMGWYQDSTTKSWRVADSAVESPMSHNGPKGAHCLIELDKLRAAGVPDTRTFDFDHDTPEFKHGIHSLAEIRASCEHLQRVGLIGHFERWAMLAMQDAPKVASGRSDQSFFKNCIQTYNAIVKAGVPATEHVPERVIAGIPWSGTIEELRTKWCDSGMAKAKGNLTAEEAPFRAELKGDKLRLALKYQSFFLPGGAGTGDAHRLSQASVWFLDLSPSKVCLNGLQVHTIRRYAFGSSQQLTGTTEKDFCGKAPRSAFQ